MKKELIFCLALILLILPLSSGLRVSMKFDDGESLGLRQMPWMSVFEKYLTPQGGSLNIVMPGSGGNEEIWTNKIWRHRDSSFAFWPDQYTFDGRWEMNTEVEVTKIGKDIFLWRIFLNAYDRSAAQGYKSDQLLVRRDDGTGELIFTGTCDGINRDVIFYRDDLRGGWFIAEGHVNITNSGICDHEPAICGNNVIEEHEECDDGNRENGDGCSSTCKEEIEEEYEVEIVTIEANKEWLKENSNGLIDPDKYDEKVTLDNVEYKIITTGDKAMCTATIKISEAEELAPENLFVIFHHFVDGKKKYDTKWINVKDALSQNDPRIKSKNSKAINAGQGCKREGDTITCKYSPSGFSKREGTVLKCSALTRVEKKDGVEKMSEQAIVATYVFYFMPVNTGYGNIEEQYDYFTELSEINSYQYTVGKKVLLKQINVPRGFGGTMAQDVYGAEEIESEAKKRLNQELLHKPMMGEIRNPLVTLIYRQEHLDVLSKSLGTNPTGFSVMGAWMADDGVGIHISSETDRKEVFAHEMGHFLGSACDEYDYRTWTTQNLGLKTRWMLASSSKVRRLGLPNGCPNPDRENELSALEGEYHGVGFPQCCLAPTCPEEEGICITEDPNRKLLMDGDGDEYTCKLRDLKCYEKECSENSDCSGTSDSCFCDWYTKTCTACDSASGGCYKDADGKQYCGSGDVEVICEGTDTSCMSNFGSNYLNLCRDCTIMGAYCKEGVFSEGIPFRNYACVYAEIPRFCGLPDDCMGMPYQDPEGYVPKDLNPPLAINYHSVMGQDHYPNNIYPQNLGCPLRGCKYE